jgi:hypothetical protein
MAAQPIYAGAHERTPTLSTSVRIGYDDMKGRCLFADRDIPAGRVYSGRAFIPREHDALISHTHLASARVYIPGALLVRERAYAHMLGADQTATMLCHECLAILPPAPLLCSKCNDTHVRYCSEECRDSAARTFHVYQCGSDWSVDSGCW